MIDLQSGYETQVYAGVLGKVIGVYLGRPFEDWTKERLEQRWGFVDHYVHKDVGVPLVVTDDDISGTFTFVRALEDSGLYENTPESFFGETWLNYLIEGKTILWWGGIGCSEHTAYLRLKNGIKSPESGSCKLNGKTISEQVGAQIFVDGVGLVCPGNPALAVQIAQRAARVAHDGEAVYAAMVIAAMEAAAFVEKDMDKLLDIGISYIPQDSLVAQVHKDVRAWCRMDQDWRRTFERIKEKYGYARFGGGCHVIPNHALIILSLCYAPNDFRQALGIVNTCGWDTDCNSGNVGCISALVVGLDRLCEGYDFRSEMGDRIKHSTADGTFSTTDCLTEARHLAAIGRKIMKWPERQTSGHWLDFSERGAAQGFLPEESQAGISIKQVLSAECLQYDYSFEHTGSARVSLPVLQDTVPENYPKVGTAKLYPGMALQFTLGKCCSAQGVSIRAFAHYQTLDGQEKDIFSSAQALQDAAVLLLKLDIEPSAVITSIGLQLDSDQAGKGTFALSNVDIADGHFLYEVPALWQKNTQFPGWILDCDAYHRPYSTDKENMYYLGKSVERGFAYTGNRWWRDICIEAHVSMHIGGSVGMVARFQGMRRYISLTRRGDKLVLARQYYGESILAECPCMWNQDEIHILKLDCQGREIRAYFDGKEVLNCKEDILLDGAAGFTFEKALLGIGRVTISGTAQVF